MCLLCYALTHKQKTRADDKTKRELLLFQEEQARLGRPMSGRAALWHFLRRFHLDRGQALHVDISTLLALEFKGDLEGYLDALDAALMSMTKMPDDICKSNGIMMML